MLKENPAHWSVRINCEHFLICICISKASSCLAWSSSKKREMGSFLVSSHEVIFSRPHFISFFFQVIKGNLNVHYQIIVWICSTNRLNLCIDRNLHNRHRETVKSFLKATENCFPLDNVLNYFFHYGKCIPWDFERCKRNSWNINDTSFCWKFP